MIGTLPGGRMPVQSLQRTPTISGPTTQQGPAAARVDRRQQTLGNEAVQQRMGANAPGAEGAEGVAGAQSLLRDKTDSASVSVRGRLPGNASLGKAGSNEIRTDKATGFEVGAGRQGIWASFHPELLVRPDSMWSRLATGGITVSQLYFSFESGRASLSFDTGLAGDFLDLFMSLKGGIEQKFSDAVRGALPPWLTKGGYDPYTDPELTQRLASIVSSLSSAFPAASGGGGANLLNQVTEPEICANVTPKPMEIPISDGMLIKLSERASLGLTAKLTGTLGQALKHPQLRELDVRTDGLTLEHKTWGVLGGLELRSLSFGPDLSLLGMDYTLGAETGAGLLKLLGAIAELHTGQDLGVRDMNTPEFKALRAKVDAEARQKLPAMMREQLKQHENDIPGLPLHDLVSAPKS
jgi:hypothetical protein